MHNSEQQLELYRLLFENSLGLMCIHDLDGVLLLINPAVAESLGYRVEDGVGKNLREFLAPSVRHLFDVYLDRIKTNRTESGMMRLLARDGSERIWFYRNLRYEAAGSPPCVLGHGLDITERVRTEQALKDSQRALSKARDELTIRVAERTAELQAANERLRAEIKQREHIEDQLLQARKMESLGVLAGGIAHDFNNLLTIILGNIAQAQTKIRPGDALEDMLQQIERASERAAALTVQLMTFAKGGAPVKRTASIAQLLHDSVELARAGSSVRFETHVPGDLWSADIDPAQINQVFHNVLLNAREAMTSSGIIEVRASNVVWNSEIQPPRPGKYVRISIHDQGCGIPAEILPRIFDPYFSTKHTGSGLGLATAYSIVTKHQGWITVDSAPGLGTTFYVYLPASDKTADPVADPPSSTLNGFRRLLVMDDEKAILRFLDEFLSGAGYEVRCTTEGREALDAYREALSAGRPFDAVLLDLTVPGGMGGVETAARLREMDPDARLIVSSGYSEAPILSDFRRYGFDDVIAKPWSVAELTAVLNRVARKLQRNGEAGAH
jgi:PAS domain S-box-containing protein